MYKFIITWCKNPIESLWLNGAKYILCAIYIAIDLFYNF